MDDSGKSAVRGNRRLNRGSTIHLKPCRCKTETACWTSGISAVTSQREPCSSSTIWLAIARFSVKAKRKAQAKHQVLPELTLGDTKLGEDDALGAVLPAQVGVLVFGD